MAVECLPMETVELRGAGGKKRKKIEPVWWQLWLHGSSTALQEKINS